MIASPNSIDLACAVPGIWACGAIPVFVNSEAPDAHLRHAVETTDAAVVLVAPGRTLPELSAPVLPLEMMTPEALPTPPDQEGRAPGSIVFTSGSTGAPKGVVQAADTLARGVDRVGGTLGYRADDILLCPIPFAFDYGWGHLLSLLLGGLPLVLPELRGAMGLRDALARHRPSVLAGVPAVFADLLSGLAPIRDIDRSSIRLITNTGS